MDDLTDKQRLFVQHYVACLNATEAAARAGYAGDRATLATVGYENLRKPEIRAAIDAQLAARTMPAAEVLARLDEHARGDMSDFLTVSGRGVRLDIVKALKAGKGHLIKRYAKTDRGTTLELYDAQAALGQLGKHYGLFRDGVALNINLDDLTPEQVDRIAAGEDPLTVVGRV